MNSDKGKILKLYKNEWYVDNIFLQCNVTQIKIIRQMRTGTSYLAAHSPYIFNNPDLCPCCNRYVKETNQHYLMECDRFTKDIKILLKKIIQILKNSGRKVKTKYILGFPDKNNEPILFSPVKKVKNGGKLF